MSEAVLVAEGASCRPNISPAGVRRRVRFGVWNIAVAVALVAALVVLRAPWYAGLAAFVPAAFAAVGLLQARRKTCVSRAGEGTFEHDDFSKTPAAEADVRASRAVAATITRDAILVGLAAAALTIVIVRFATRL
jgi:hypothetical protein